MFRLITLTANAILSFLAGNAALLAKAGSTTAVAELGLKEEEAACPNYVFEDARSEAEALRRGDLQNSATLQLPVPFSLLQRVQNRAPSSPPKEESANATTTGNSSTAELLASAAASAPADKQAMNSAAHNSTAEMLSSAAVPAPVVKQVNSSTYKSWAELLIPTAARGPLQTVANSSAYDSTAEQSISVAGHAVTDKQVANTSAHNSTVELPTYAATSALAEKQMVNVSPHNSTVELLPAASLHGAEKQAPLANSSEQPIHAMALAAAASALPAAGASTVTQNFTDSTAATIRTEAKVMAAADSVEAAAKATEVAEAVSAAASQRADLSAAELQQVNAAVEDAAKAHETASFQAFVAARAEDALVDAEVEPRLSDRGHPQDDVGNRAHAKAATTQLWLRKAAKMKAEAAAAGAEAAAAQAEADLAVTAVERAKAQEQICQWRMPNNCVPSFQYKGQYYDQCTSVGHVHPWCSHSEDFHGGWSECNYVCGPGAAGSLNRAKLTPAGSSRAVPMANAAAPGSLVPPFDDMEAPILAATAPASSPANFGALGDKPDDYLVPVYIPNSVLTNLQQQQEDVSTGYDVVSSGNASAPSLTLVAKSHSSGVSREESHDKSERQVTHALAADRRQDKARRTVHKAHSVGTEAALDEAGYMMVVNQKSDHQMALFVKRVVADMGCRVKDKSGISGFVPWYSGDRDMQDFPRLQRELRCICSLEQFWLEPIGAPPEAEVEDCEGTRWPEMVDYDAE